MMEPVCYVCQEYENDIGHITSLCPNKECKKCGQKGHFGYECESLENISIKKENCNIVEDNNDEIKTENYVNIATGEKTSIPSIMCPICNKGFTAENSMKRHIKVCS